MTLFLPGSAQLVATVSFVPPAINTGHPDIAKIQSMVTAAIDRSENGKKAPAKTAQASGAKTARAKKGYTRGQQSTVGGSIGNLHDGYAANAATDLSSAC